jgi:hypothetical protein
MEILVCLRDAKPCRCGTLCVVSPPSPHLSDSVPPTDALCWHMPTQFEAHASLLYNTSFYFEVGEVSACCAYTCISVLLVGDLIIMTLLGVESNRMYHARAPQVMG